MRRSEGVNIQIHTLDQKEVSRVWLYREAEEDTSPRQFVVRPEP
jgi:hypothetical protein